MKHVKYPESIFCHQCQDHVEMVDCKVLEKKVKGRLHIEFDYVCVSCGTRAAATRDWEYLQYSEREFCQKNGLADFGAEVKGKGVVYERTTSSKS